MPAGSQPSHDRDHARDAGAHGRPVPAALSSELLLIEPARPDPPRIWLILGDKAGDNAQVRIIADALGSVAGAVALFVVVAIVADKRKRNRSPAR